MRTWTTRLCTMTLTAMSTLPLIGCQTDKGTTWPAFGTYRLPYATGTEVKVNNDFTTHSPLGRYDLKGKGGGPYTVVAAADGWIRYIVDYNIGHGTGDNNYVWIEHPFPYCQAAGVTWPGKPADYDQTCVPCQGTRCNEWTKYSHMEPGSTTGAGLAEGDWVTAGTFLGIEDDIGHASGDHLHWEVAKLDPAQPFSNVANGWTFDWSFGGWLASPNVLPSICGVGILYDGDTHTAAPCPDASRQAPIGMQLSWQSESPEPVAATASLVVDGPDRNGRITLSNLRLTSPVVLEYGASRVRVSSLRLVRPATVQLGRDGTGRLPADQLNFSTTLVIESPDGSQVRRRADGPVRGLLSVAVAGGRMQLVLEAGRFGTISGVATMSR